MKPGSEGFAAGRSLPMVNEVIFIAGLFISVLDFLILQQAEYKFTVANAGGIILLLAGSGLRSAARRALGESFSQVVKASSKQTLVTSGVYRMARHPIYLGEILVYLSIPMIFSSFYGIIPVFVLIPSSLYRIKVEEKALSSHFGQEYAEYKKRTKKIVPYLY